MRTHSFARQFFVAVSPFRCPPLPQASLCSRRERQADTRHRAHRRRELAGTFKFTEGPTTDKDGVVYFSDMPADQIFKVDPGDKTPLFRSDTHHANGQMFNSAGEIVCCQPQRRSLPVVPPRPRPNASWPANTTARLPSTGRMIS